MMDIRRNLRIRSHPRLVDAKIARNFDPTPEVSQSIDLVGKEWD
jgi:hypothetical protein